MIYLEKLKTFFRRPLVALKQSGKKSSIELLAYQESARVVMAYAFGYRCRQGGLRKPVAGISRTELDFKNHTVIVNALISFCR